MAAPDEAPIAWPDHPLAVSDGEILATRVLPLMGHNARDFARAAAVCRGWRAACRAATATPSLYRETTLLPAHPSGGVYAFNNVEWSPCGKFIALASGRFIGNRPGPPRIFVWRASTGALVNAWALATPAAAVSPYILECAFSYFIRVAFSRDSTRVLTTYPSTTNFSLWNVLDGQLAAVNPGIPHGDSPYESADFGVPGSASEGLIGFSAPFTNDIDLWEVAPSPEGGGSRPRLRSRVQLGPLADSSVFAFKFSPDGSKFAASSCGVAYVYDVASLTRLGVYNSPLFGAAVAWAPHGRHVLVSWDNSACVWDFSRPEEAPPVITPHIGLNAELQELVAQRRLLLRRPQIEAARGGPGRADDLRAAGAEGCRRLARPRLLPAPPGPRQKHARPPVA